MRYTRGPGLSGAPSPCPALLVTEEEASEEEAQCGGLSKKGRYKEKEEREESVENI